jgi:hypothetical protein
MLARIAAEAQDAAATPTVLGEALAANPEDPTLRQLKAEPDVAGQ